MPDGRFLSKSVAHDLELNGVSLEADLVFTRCIPHLDVEGRMPGHPSQVKGIAVPLRHELTLGVVERCLAELQEAGLVAWYEVDGRQYLEFPGFRDNQKGLRKDREAESRIPSPKVKAAQRVTPSLRTNSGVGPEPLPESSGVGPHKLSEVKLSQGKLSTTGLSTFPPSAESPGRAREPAERRQEGMNPDHEPPEPTAGEIRQHQVEDRAAILTEWHLGRSTIHVNGSEVTMGIEMTIRKELIRRHGPEAVHGALPLLRQVEEFDQDEPVSLRVAEQRPEVMERLIARWEEQQPVSEFAKNASEEVG